MKNKKEENKDGGEDTQTVEKIKFLLITEMKLQKTDEKCIDLFNTYLSEKKKGSIQDQMTQIKLHKEIKKYVRVITELSDN